MIEKGFGDSVDYEPEPQKRLKLDQQPPKSNAVVDFIKAHLKMAYKDDIQRHKNETMETVEMLLKDAKLYGVENQQKEWNLMNLSMALNQSIEDRHDIEFSFCIVKGIKIQ